MKQPSCNLYFPLPSSPELHPHVLEHGQGHLPREGSLWAAVCKTASLPAAREPPAGSGARELTAKLHGETAVGSPPRAVRKEGSLTKARQQHEEDNLCLSAEES